MQEQDRMMKEPHEGMSAFWRKNTSSLEAVELANLVRALRKVVGHLGTGAPGVEYAGMAGGGSSAIMVDPSQVMGAYPVPPDRVDLLTGEVVHEALLVMEWSERVWKILDPCCAAMEGIPLIKFQKIVKTAEDIYVDSILEGTMLGNTWPWRGTRSCMGPRHAPSFQIRRLLRRADPPLVGRLVRRSGTLCAGCAPRRGP
jgi:hypothetical protein